MSKIVIHQAYYGEVNRAHSKILQTIDDSELTSFLIRFTDRPGSLAPGVVLNPYLSGSSFKKYYVFSKTFPDPKASRSGMVITHVLIVDTSTLENLNDLKSILSLLISEAPVEKTSLEPIELDVKHSALSYENRQPIFIQKFLSSFIKGDLPIMFTGDLVSFEKILQKLWNSPISGFREQLKFRASFSPKDLEGSDDLTLVFIQSELLSKWNSNKLISGEENDIIEITSPTESLFLGREKENPLYDFLKTIGANLEELNTYTQGDILFEDYVDLDNLNDPDLLRRDLRILSKLSPNKNLGASVKEEFIEKYNGLINNGLESNVKGLRNISWNAYIDGEEKAKNLVNAILDKAIRNSKFKHIEILSEVSSTAVNETNKTWWHRAIVDSFKKNVLKAEETIQKSIWKLLLLSKDSAKSIFSVIPSRKDSESLLIQHLPKEVPTEIGKTALLELQKRKWYLLHAEILLKLYKPVEAVEKQLSFEDSISYDGSIGLKLILKKLSDNEVLAITLKLCNDKLIQGLIKRVVENESILKSIDLQVPCWLNIWTALLYADKPFNYGIKGKEQAVVFSVFDLALKGKQIDNVIFEKIAYTTYSNISDYRNRQNIWAYIPASYQAKYIESTADSFVERIVNKGVDGSSIEETLANHITSKSYMTSFLSKYRNDIEPALKIFESFTSHSDKFLSDYITYYQSQITENQSRRLGTLILSRNYTTSARAVYDKSRFYGSFTLAYEVCKSLVKLNWFESFWSSPSSQYKSQYYPMEQPKNNSENHIESLPTIVILTAIEEEYNAVRQFLKEVVEVDQDDTTYEAGIFSLYDKDVAKVIIRECGAKNTIAAQETERAISHFKPDAIFFVGIAGSRKPNDFSIGDVIFPREIYSYESGKAEKDKFMARPDLASSTYALAEIAKKERRKDEWKTLIKNGWDTKVKANLGIIASGEQLIEDYESEVGKILTEHYNDTSAVEMEGFGFAKAAVRQGRSSGNMMIGVVRGISDIIKQPGKKKNESSNDRRPDNAKQLASDTAAAFAYWLIFKAFP
jgi:nucleoside phosphorylase